MYEKLPFKKYTILNNYLVQSLGCSDVYRVFILSLTADKRELTTDTTIDQLAMMVGESSSNYSNGKKSKSFNDKLRETGEVTLEPFTQNKKSRIRYRFNPPVRFKYRRIGRKFHDEYKHLDRKLLGFILKLFSATEPYSCLIKLSKRKLEKVIKMGHSTISNYTSQLIELNLLEETENGMLLKVKGLILDIPISEKTKEDIEVYERILKNREETNSPLPRSAAIYKKYKDNDFRDVKNMNAFMRSISSGLVGRKKPKKKEKVLIIL